MNPKIAIFLHFFVLVKIAQTQFNYGSHTYYTAKESLKHPLNTLQLDNPGAPGSAIINLWSKPPKCSPPTATAYFLPASPIAPKVMVLDTKQSNIILEPLIRETSENIPPPTHPCPFCTGKINVPPKFDVPPPPPSYSVMPGVIETIPSMMPLVDNGKECDCLSRGIAMMDDVIDTSCLLPNTFNYDQELLEGFLRSLGL